MRILLDEDTPVQLVDVLRHPMPRHRLDQHPGHRSASGPGPRIRGIGWSGKKDRAVLADARTAKYDAILTSDAGQLEDPDETDAIRKSGLHHIRYTQRQPGLRGLALAMGAVISSMPGIAEDLERAAGQRLVQIHGLEPRGRYKIIDPVRDPPRYWR